MDQGLIIEKILIPCLKEIFYALHGEGEPFPTCLPTTPIFGENALLDSIELVNFIIRVEEEVSQQLKKRVTLVSDKAMSANGPFKTLSSLSQFIQEKIA
jgi:hypothetical protein